MVIRCTYIRVRDVLNRESEVVEKTFMYNFSVHTSPPPTHIQIKINSPGEELQD